jgi:SAM-dependent methyltransferase
MAGVVGWSVIARAYTARMRRTPLVIAGAALGAAAIAILVRRGAGGTALETPEGILLADASLYDRLAGAVLGGFYEGIARDVAAAAPPGGRVLDVGCGPGHVVEHLAAHGLLVTGIDLDPRMIERARLRLGATASLAVADVAALPFEADSFDVVLSTLSMHHWADTPGGLAEIARVLRPEGTALVYDLGGVLVPLHGGGHHPVDHVRGSALRVVDERPWRWPGPIALAHRIEARRA